MSGFRRGFPLLLLPALLAGAAVRADAEPAQAASEAASLVDLRLDPLGLLFGIFGVSADFGIGRHFQLGPSFQWYGSGASGRTVTALQYGLTSTYLWSSKPDSPFARAILTYLPVSTAFPGRTLNVSNYGFGLLAGYRWEWEKGFLVSLGIGAIYHDTPAAGGAPSSIELQPELEWSVGWQF